MLTLDDERRVTVELPVLNAGTSAPVPVLATGASGAEPDTVWWLEAERPAGEIDCVHWLIT